MAARKPKTHTPPVPAELASWLAERLRTIEADMVDISACDAEDEAGWCLHVLARLANIEILSTEMTRLMTKYMVDGELARPATIAKLTGVHQSSVTSRASGQVAREAWSEVWPAKS